MCFGDQAGFVACAIKIGILDFKQITFRGSLLNTAADNKLQQRIRKVHRRITWELKCHIKLTQAKPQIGSRRVCFPVKGLALLNQTTRPFHATSAS